MTALLLQLRADLAALEVRWAIAKLAYKYNFNPAQPRVPAGTPDGGRWTDTGGNGWVRVATNDRGEGGIATDAGTGSSMAIPAMPAGTSIDANIAEAERHRYSLQDVGDYPSMDMASAIWFYQQVNDGGVWDYKRRDPKKFEDFGNFNYGATGRALGFSEETLLRMAGVKQVQDNHSHPDWGVPANIFAAFLGVGGKAPFGDDPYDQMWIKRGIRYYEASRKVRPTG